MGGTARICQCPCKRSAPPPHASLATGALRLSISSDRTRNAREDEAFSVPEDDFDRYCDFARGS